MSVKFALIQVILWILNNIIKKKLEILNRINNTMKYMIALPVYIIFATSLKENSLKYHTKKENI